MPFDIVTREFPTIRISFHSKDDQECQILGGDPVVKPGAILYLADKYRNLMLIRIHRERRDGRVQCRLIYTTYNELLKNRTPTEIKEIIKSLEIIREQYDYEHVGLVINLTQVLLNHPINQDFPATNNRIARQLYEILHRENVPG